MKDRTTYIALTVAFMVIAPSQSLLHAQDITYSAILETQQRLITGLAVSKDGRSLATAGSNGTLKLWDLKTNKRLFSITTGESSLRTVAIHPSGKWIATGDRDSTINIVDVQIKRSVGKHKTETNSIGGIRRLQFSADGKYLLSTNVFLRLWRVTDKKPVISPHETLTRAGLYASFSPDGKRIAFMDGFRLVFHDVESGRKIGTLMRLRAPMINLAFSPDGRLLFGYRRSRRVPEIVQIDVTNKKESSPFKIKAFGYAISPNGKWIAIIDRDYKRTKCLAKVFDVASAKSILSLRFADPVAISTGPIAFTTDNAKLLTAVDSKIYIWDIPKNLLKK